MESHASLKKPFQNSGSDNHTPRISADSSDHEQLRISDLDAAVDSAVENREVIVKIDGGERDDDGAGRSSIWRCSSYEFWRDGQRSGGGAGFITDNQNDALGNRSLDVDLEMDEVSRDRNSNLLNPNPESPVQGVTNNERANTNDRYSNSKMRDTDREMRRHEGSSDEDESEHFRLQQHCKHNRRRTRNKSRVFDDPDDNDSGEVLKCTSFKRRASFTRTRTMSRLMDPPDVSFPEQASESGQPKQRKLQRCSAILMRSETVEEDDSLFDEDNPDDIKHNKLNALAVAEYISLIMIMTSLLFTLSIYELKQKSLRGLYFWEWEVLVLVLICGRLVSDWGIRIVVFVIERNFLLRKRVLYFVYGIRKSVQHCIWLGLVLFAWHIMFDEKVEGHIKLLRVVNRVMVCMFVSTSLWLVKTLMVKVLASSFHVSKFFDRIQDNLFNQYVIETLSGPPLLDPNNDIHESTLMEIMRLEEQGLDVPLKLRAKEFLSRSGRLTSWRASSRGASFRYPEPKGKDVDEKDQGISIDQLTKLNSNNVSAWNMKRLMKIIRHGSLTTLEEQLHGMKKKDDTPGKQIKSELEAKRSARKIFLNVARQDSNYIYLDDLMRFLKEEEAERTMGLLMGSPGDEKVSKAALKNWVIHAFRERKALALTLNDTKTAVKKLHHMVDVLAGIIILVICLLILGIATSRFLLFISSQIVVVAFIFGNTCKTVFEAIIFLFIMHPFDVGDRCEIDGVQMVVEEMNIFNTVFLRFDNQKIYFPNSVLLQRRIGNYYRSPDMSDSIDFCIHVATPFDKITTIKQRIINYIESNKDHWYASPSVILMNMNGLSQLKMSVWLRHKMNHQDMGERWMRRAVVVEEMIRIFKEVDIEFRMFPLDVNIESIPPPVTSTRVPPTWIN